MTSLVKFVSQEQRVLTTDRLSRLLLIVAVVPFLVAMLLGSMLPPVDFDVKEYHLQGPKEFFQAGRITMLPHNVYTSFPFLTEMLSLLGMVIRDDWYWGALAGKAVRINHFNVGWVITPNEYKLKITEGLPEGWPDDPPLDAVPTGCMTQPEQIAAQAVFWLSDQSHPVSGSVIDLEQFPVIGRIPLKEGD